MVLNSNFVFERSFYLSTVPGVRYKESIPEEQCKKQQKFLNRGNS